MKNLVTVTKKLIKDAATESDNCTYDVFRIVFILATIMFLGLTAFVAIKTGSFNPSEWATGFSQLFGSGAVGVGVKSKLEGPAQRSEP